MPIKPQPEHDADTLARAERVAPGVQSDYGRRTLISQRLADGIHNRPRFIIGPRAEFKPDLPPAVLRKRWN